MQGSADLSNNPKKEENLMEAAKKKEIEDRLYELIAQSADQAKKKKLPAKLQSFGANVIRRRKGKPDLHIA